MTGIYTWSLTPSLNINANTGLNWDEGMSPAAVNNTARAEMTDIRSQFNDLVWFQYGTGTGAVPGVYASGTSFTIAGVDVTAVYHAGRRVRAIGSGTGTIYGSISSSSFSTNTTVNVTWDSGSLSNETLAIYLSQIPVTGNPASSAGGSVTSVSVTTANGVSGSVANPTTTPALTLALGAITPTSVAASGSVSGSNLSGTNTGNQTITLTGDVTGSGTGSFATALANSAVTPGSYTIANITVDQQGRVTAAANGTIAGAAQQGIFFNDNGSSATAAYAFGGCSVLRTGQGSYTITLGSTPLVVGSWQSQSVNNGSGDTVGMTCSTTTALAANSSYSFTTRFSSSKSTANATSCLVLFF